MTSEQPYYKISTATLPEFGQPYDFEPYLDRIGDNLLGPLRQFRGAMLDLGNLLTADPEQRKAFRSYVFDRTEEMMELMIDWLAFYGVDEVTVKEAMRNAHPG